MNPNAEIDRPIRTLIAATALAVTTAVLSVTVPLVIRNFDTLFKGFDAEISGFTRFVIASRYAWWLFTLAAIRLLVWVGANKRVKPDELRKMRLALRVLTVVVGLAMGGAVIAMYYPIFKLGAVV